MFISIGNYFFNTCDIRCVRGADGIDNGIYITFVGGLINFYSDITLEAFRDALERI